MLSFKFSILPETLNGNSLMFGVEDISGIPWIEIDYKSDLKKAQSEIITKIT